ncbi:MAG TPA: carboxypeptidase regulatory-like domain-containing protein [Candidatus Saccharimonadales bacterium]|nr:carboxypeptidase regulatory-like domain-containing protein [Candidatus Saccharimonadales bacterium]
MWARTAADGSFHLGSLGPGTLRIRVFAEGMAPAQANPGPGGDLRILLTKGTPLKGRVVAPDGRTPVEGAWVLAGPSGIDGLSLSAADGSFEIPRLRPGSFEIRAETGPSPDAEAPPEGAEALPRELMAPSAPARISTPTAGASSPLTLELRTGGSLQVRVIDSGSRTAVPGALARLEEPGGEARILATDSSGEALFRGIPAGRIRVDASADGFFGESGQTLDLASRQTAKRSLALEPSASLSGTVRDTAGHPVSGANLTASGPPPLPLPIPIFFPLGVAPVTSDPQGRFALDDLPADKDLKITAEFPGFVPRDFTGVRLKPREARKGLEILLESGLSITGHVVDLDGRPLTGVSLTASRKHEGGMGGMAIRIGSGRRRGSFRAGEGSPDSLPPVLTVSDGSFSVQGARPGIWSLDARAPGYAPASAGGLRLEEGATVVDAGEITLQPGAHVRGRVIDPDGNPIAGAEGHVVHDFESLGDFTTDATGAFDVPDLAAGSNVTVRIDADGYARGEAAGVVAPTDDVEITLQASSKVSGQVLDAATRQPITEFSVGVSRERSFGGGAMRSVDLGGAPVPFQDEEGHFVLEDIEPGKITLTARAPGYRDAVMKDLDVPAGGEIEEIRLLLERGATIQGQVTDDRSVPVAGARISRQREEAGGMRIAIGPGGEGTYSDGDGYFSMDGLERGPMTLSVTHDGYEPAQVAVDTTSDVEGLNVVLSRGGTISGTVLLADGGTPVAEASVTLAAAGAPGLMDRKSAISDPDGSFSFEGLAAGRYALTIEARGLQTASLDSIVVQAGTPTPPVEVRLTGGVTLLGTLTGVRPEEMGDFSIRAVPASSGGGFGTSSAVDADGRFEFHGLAPGTIRLIASSGFLTGRTASKSVEIPTGVDSMETVLEFPPGNVVTGVVTRGGDGVGGLTVSFNQTGGAKRSAGTTDASGYYRVEDLDDGDYAVRVFSLGSGVSHEESFHLEGDATLDIVLPQARLAGYVRDGGTGKPIEGARVTWKLQGGSTPATGGFVMETGTETDSDGRWEAGGLEEGTYEIRASREGYAYATSTAEIVSGATPGDVLMDLFPTDALAFRVTDGVSGQPLRSVSVLALEEDDPRARTGKIAFRGSLTASAAGIFQLTSLRPGTYRLILGGQSVGTLTQHGVKVPAGSVASWTLPQGGELELTYTGPAGSGPPPAGPAAWLLDGAGLPVHWSLYVESCEVPLDPATGPRTLRSLPAGEYQLVLRQVDGSERAYTVTITAGGATRLEVP